MLKKAIAETPKPGSLGHSDTTNSISLIHDTVEPDEHLHIREIERGVGKVSFVRVGRQLTDVVTQPCEIAPPVRADRIEVIGDI